MLEHVLAHVPVFWFKIHTRESGEGENCLSEVLNSFVTPTPYTYLFLQNKNGIFHASRRVGHTGLANVMEKMFKIEVSLKKA